MSVRLWTDPERSLAVERWIETVAWLAERHRARRAVGDPCRRMPRTVVRPHTVDPAPYGTMEGMDGVTVS